VCHLDDPPEHTPPGRALSDQVLPNHRGFEKLVDSGPALETRHDISDAIGGIVPDDNVCCSCMEKGPNCLRRERARRECDHKHASGAAETRPTNEITVAVVVKT
jgi:hypothetical protein